jgi:DNA-binding SARP family transcriptional activator
VPPWASDPADPVLGELVRYSEATEGAGILCCASSEGALCLWELADQTTGRPALRFGDGRRIPALDYQKAVREEIAPGSPNSFQVPSTEQDQTAAPSRPPRTSPIEVAVLGSVQVSGAPESFRQRRRLTELVAYLAMHPEGATSDAFATALWPERRVPMQTLANRLSEARKALGAASDGRPRLRKEGGRHLIVEAETDWDRFRDLASEGRGADSWRRALALVRGRPFDGLDRGEWAQLEGFGAAIEATVVGVACRLGEYSLGRAKPGIAHWAALQGLLVSPWDERLYRLLMRAADGLGNRGGVDAALRSLALALELEGDPLLGIHPETSALYRSLMSRSAT